MEGSRPEFWDYDLQQNQNRADAVPTAEIDALPMGLFEMYLLASFPGYVDTEALARYRTASHQVARFVSKCIQANLCFQFLGCCQIA